MDDQSHFYRGVPKDMEDPVLPHPTKKNKKIKFFKIKTRLQKNNISFKKRTKNIKRKL